MKNVLKRSLTLLMSVILIAGLMCTGVSAAAERPVSVELDGKAVAFTDAEPQVIDGRTYVPFRAVFEALGAEVSFDESTRAVSASRNGTTVTIPIDSYEITIRNAALSYTDYMDAKAFVSDAGRTYIPVRYAAEALGCCVGWDADDRTVILVDTESMVKNAVEKGQFTLLEKYMAYTEKLNKGNYEVKLDMDMAYTLLATKAMTAKCEAAGIVAGGTAGELSMKMKLDMAGLVDLLTKLGEADSKEITEALAQAGINDMNMEVTVQVRMDLDKGSMYMNMSGIPVMEAALPADTWLYIDINELLDELSGYGVSPLDMSSINTVSLQQMLVPMINQMNYIYDKDSACSELKTQVDAILGAFADSAFVRNGQSYTNTQKLDALDITVRLDTNAAGEVVGYELKGGMTMKLEEMGISEYYIEEIMEYGEQLGVTLKPDDLKLSFSTGMDANNKETVKLELSMGNLVLVTADAVGTYTATTKTPSTGLPAGAKSIGLEQWIESMYKY